MFRLSTVTTTRGHRLRLATVGSAEIGPCAPILLIHPINMRKECWLGLLPTLASTRTCILVDLAGHGESDDDDFSLDAWVSDCAELVAGLDSPSLHVAGGSMGGAIALGLAATLPDRIRSVTGLGSSIRPDADADGTPPAPADDDAVDQLFASLAREAVAPGASDEVVETVRLLTNRHGADVVTRVLRAAYTADASAWLSRVRCPVLWATGDHDVTLSLEEGRRIAHEAGGTHVALPGVGHLPMIEDPALVLLHLLPHLEAADSLAAAASSLAQR